MNSGTVPPTHQDETPRRVEFFRLPQPGKRDPYFGLSRGWYYKAAALGEIKLVAVKLRGAQRGVRLVSYASVRDYIARGMNVETADAKLSDLLGEAGARGVA